MPSKRDSSGRCKGTSTSRRGHVSWADDGSRRGRPKQAGQARGRVIMADRLEPPEFQQVLGADRCVHDILRQSRNELAFGVKQTRRGDEVFQS